MPRSAAGQGSSEPAPGRDEAPADGAAREPSSTPEQIEEIGGPKGPEPTRYGDWEKGGRCSDF